MWLCKKTSVCKHQLWTWEALLSVMFFRLCISIVFLHGHILGFLWYLKNVSFIVIYIYLQFPLWFITCNTWLENKVSMGNHLLRRSPFSEVISALRSATSVLLLFDETDLLAAMLVVRLSSLDCCNSRRTWIDLVAFSTSWTERN